ncbi:MAG TPA: transposase [Terriglobales bacterium]|nr:transposase [Terriglobales bacterium]
MPEHFHLLITEPEEGDPSVVVKVVKERFSRRVNRKRKQAAVEQGVLWERPREPVWQKPFYDFNVWSARKPVEKLRYLRRNPVKRGLVERPEQWMWSSFRAYCYGETGPVRVKFQEWALEINRRPVQSFAEVAPGTPSCFGRSSKTKPRYTSTEKWPTLLTLAF